MGEIDGGGCERGGRKDGGAGAERERQAHRDANNRLPD